MNQSNAISTAQYGATLLRVSLGIMWVAHASLKWFVFTLPGTARYFDSIGITGFLAYPVFAAELIGGLALAFGIYARQASIALLPIMVVAASVHWTNGWVHTSPGGGWEYPVFLIAVSLAVWLLGDGAFALRRTTFLTPTLSRSAS